MVNKSVGRSGKPSITIFHCINTLSRDAALSGGDMADDADVHFVPLPCSSMVKDVYLLRAFEAGADAVAVLVCPEGACRYVEGNLRAKKRVQLVQGMLDEIGIGGKRLSLFNVAPGDEKAVHKIIQALRADVLVLGPGSLLRK